MNSTLDNILTKLHMIKECIKLMLKAYSQIKKYECYFLSLVFTHHLIFQAMLFYLGINFVVNPVRQASLISLNICFSLISFIIIGEKIMKRVYPMPIVVICAIFPIFMGFSLCYSLIKFDFNSLALFNSGAFFIFSLPGALWGLEIGAKSRWDDMFSFTEKIGFVLLPLAIIYFIKFLISGIHFTERNIGAITYMAMAYGLLPFFLVSIINYISGKFIFADSKFLAKIKVGVYFRSLVIIIYWTDIVISRCRGAVVSVFLFFGVLFLYMRYKHIDCKKILNVILCCVSIFLVHLYYLHMQKQDSRFGFFADSLRRGKIVTAAEKPIVSESLALMVNSETNTPPAPVVEIKKLITNRGTLFKLAIFEVLDKPLTGLSPLGFTMKYGKGKYPHNAILEALADFGFIIGGLIVLLFIKSTVRLIIGLFKGSINLGYMIIFLIGMTFSTMISGSLYTSIPIFFGVCFSLSIDKSEIYNHIKREDHASSICLYS